MKTSAIHLVLHLALGFGRGDATDAARRWLAALPPRDGHAAEPRLPMDVDAFDAPHVATFEHGVTPMGIRNLGVSNDGKWGGSLRFLPAEGRGSPALMFTSGFHPEVGVVWSYLREAAPAVVAALRPRAATLGGFGVSANPPEVFVDGPLPSVFGPWTFVALSGLPAALVEALHSLPDCRVDSVGEGLAVEAVADPFATPSPAFVAALTKLPITPPRRYLHLPFPSPVR